MFNDANRPTSDSLCNISTTAMPTHYLLPCPACEHPFELTARQAGQPLNCSQCEHAFEAPKLGTLKQLPVSGEGSADPAASKKESTGWKKYVFASGLIIAVVAGIAGAALYWYSQSLFTPTDVEGHISQVIEKDLDQFSPAQLWDLWKRQDLEGGLGEWFEPEYMGDNIQSNILKNFSYGLLGLAGLGVLILLSSFAMKGSD